ncbi:hypothetical protein ELQ35_01130 [Peribacillus cavernae]|uniref:Plasmid pRiA4b Orf3-like domain-containing protein n=2 Tax=Peribacillus cavernae TaxID=1674310 RepID=A0A3S0VIH6_9BACI|nr:hypothetical protein ELQ35_01130 [Peribacillus cavernae]
MIKDDDLIEHPVCLNGKRACPPEDVGGVREYTKLVFMLKGKNNKEGKEELLECARLDLKDYVIFI